jgi:F0F1-type ATP synthase membrane subunit b/b'
VGDIEFKRQQEERQMELRQQRREWEEELDRELERLSFYEARTIKKLGWSQDDVNRFLKDFSGVG